MSSSTRMLYGLVLVAGLSTFPGCAALSTPLFNFGMADEVAAPAAGDATFSVVLRPENAQPKKADFPLRTGMLVSEALTETGAMKKFHRRNVYLERSLQNGQKLRLEVHLDGSQRHVVPAFDYEMHPGDRLVVVEDPSTVLDDMFGSILEPLGPLR